MTSRLGNLFRRRTAVQEGRQNPTLLATVDKSSEIYDRIPLKNFIEDDKRDSLARQLYLDINDICNAIEPITACREKLAKTMIEFASYQVLMIPPPPEEDSSGLRSQPGISGELKAQLERIAETNERIRSALFEKSDKPSTDVIWEFVQRSYWQGFWFLETFNAARIELGDFNKTRDWFLAFKHAACANCEHIYRRELEMPPAFEEESASETATAYSIFTDIVLSGAEEPEQEWRDYHRDSGITFPRFDE